MAANYANLSPESCSFLHLEDIMVEIVNNQQWEDLEDLYQAQSWNPYFDVDYGANVSGIFVMAFPPEDLHTLEQGNFKHLLEEGLGVVLKPEQIPCFYTEKFNPGFPSHVNICSGPPTFLNHCA
jgi:hypothetical protein